MTPFVIRTKKRRAIDDRGEPLFQPRTTRMVPVEWEERHHLQQQLYEAVTEYVRQGLLDPLFELNRKHDGTRLGEQATKEFVLTHCFGIVPDLIGSPVELMCVLLSQHYQQARFTIKAK